MIDKTKLEELRNRVAMVIGDPLRGTIHECIDTISTLLDENEKLRRVKEAAECVGHSIAGTRGSKTNSELPEWFALRLDDLNKSLIALERKEQGMNRERKHESYCWEGHANVHKGCKCGCHNDKEMTAEEMANNILEKLWKNPGFGEDLWFEYRDLIVKDIKQASQEAYDRGLEDAAMVAENYWAHRPQEEFDDGFEIPQKSDGPYFVHEDIAKKIRNLKSKGKYGI